MLFLLLFFFMHTVSPDGSAGTVNDQYSFNLTMSLPTTRSIDISWNCDGQRIHDKYEVTLQPVGVSYKIVETVPRNTCYLTMGNLNPDTAYQISVSSVSGRVRRRSNILLFRTLMEDSTEIVTNEGELEIGEEKVRETGLKLPNVKVVEISLVAMALILWAGAIVLFFHRWGKIRMLLPYQPAYKEMQKNGSSTCTNCSMTPHHQCSRTLQQMQDFGLISTAAGAIGAGAASLGILQSFADKESDFPIFKEFADTGCSPMRPRLNSYVAYSQNEFPRYIYRKALSCDHLPLSNRFWFDDDISDA